MGGAIAERGKKRRRRRYHAERKLELAVRVPVWREVTRKASAWRRPMVALVRVLPAFPSSQQGRTQANVIRVAMGVGAALLVSRGGDHIVWGVLGVVLALMTLVLPLSEARKFRWTRWAGGLGAPGRRRESAAGRFIWDGTKLTVRGPERVWRSLRPRNPPCGVVVAEPGAHVVLALCPTDKREPLVFQAIRADVPETYDPIEARGELPEGWQDEVVDVDGDVFAALHEALYDAATGEIPRAAGPKQTPKKKR